MLRAHILIFVVAVLSSRADARLWETVAQAETRFGRPVEISRGQAPGEEDRRYAWKDFVVLVTYVGGKTENELYAHREIRKPFSDGEVQSLLKISSAGKWSRPGSERIWYLIGSDGKTQIAAAAYFPKLPRVNAPAFMAFTVSYSRRHRLLNI